MEFTFGCGTTLNLSELNNYRYEYMPLDEDDDWDEDGYDTDVGTIGQLFWDINELASDRSDICFTQSDDYSEYIEDNGEVFIPVEHLCVAFRAVVAKPLPLDRQMEVAKDTLEKIRLASPKAVVAGGAARCFLQGEQANDIDIFLDLPAYLNSGEMLRMLRNLLPDKNISSVAGGYSGTPSNVTGLRCAYHFYEEGQEVQLLVVDGRPDQQMNRFPYSHSQISWDGEQFTYHDNFEMFLDFKVVIKNYHPPQASYEAKVQKLFEERGWAVAQSQEEALTMAMDSVRLTV